MTEQKIVRRGYITTDKKDFGKEALPILRKAGEELYFLLNRGYPIKPASVFIGNHYLLSERQRLALARCISSKEALTLRRKKEKTDMQGKVIYIDGFNLIITLEVALSHSTLLSCMDNTIRDLAGLRGTYRLIDKTQEAIEWLGTTLEKLHIAKAVIYLDSPVSNSGRLKMKLLELLQDKSFETQVELVNNADVMLKEKEYVISSDAIVLNQCKSFSNLITLMLKERKIPLINFIDF